ncbi:MAG: restriction endonuclease subunit S [Candidatus Omnitrophota bacterium]|nr:restriction endonuclease subunit S [Candidatus Omnitrophota bacterium]
MKYYPAYKDSKIEWFPSIPKHWQLIKLGRIGRFSASGIDKKSDASELPVRMVNYTNVYGNSSLEIKFSENLMETTTTLEKVREHSLKKGDMVFTPSSETAEDIGLSAVVTAELRNTVYSYHLIRLRTGERYNLNLGFKKYFCNVHEVLSQFSKACKGTTRQILGRDDFKDILILLPPVSEQKIIAEYLNRKAAQVDDLIAKKERMIDLIKEERAAITNRAVTKGLDPNVEMKDSGIEWLGKMPKHWQMKRLKYLVSLVNQPIEEVNGAELRIDLENLESWTGKTIELESQDQNNEGMKSFAPGDVLFNKLRPYLAKVYRAKNCGVCGGELLVLRPTTLIDPDFLFCRVLSSAFINVVDGSTYGSKMPRASWDFIGNLIVPFPSKPEQIKIAEYLHQTLQRMDIILQKLGSEIEYLREYRTALISEVVTGKIDVRGF